MRKYEIEVTGEGWMWSGEVEAASVEAAAKSVLDTLNELYEYEEEITLEHGTMRLGCYNTEPETWRINGRECVVEQEIDGSCLVYLAERIPFA